MTDGIYTLANDVVYDQLVALLNSIEVNIGVDYPVQIIPYDDNLDKVRAEVKKRQNVEVFSDQNILERWEDFSTQIWQTHPFAYKLWQERGIQGVNRLGMHRRFCGFDPDSPFERFIYFDGDVLVLNPLDYIFKQLEQSDFVVYDFQYKDLSHVYNVESSKLSEVFAKERTDKEIFCAGFFAAKRGLFSSEKRDWLIKQLQGGEAEILYPNAPDQTILNYMVMRSGIPAYNFALNLPTEQKTGCSVTSAHFERRDDLLYDRGTPLTYLHYIGVPAWVFTKVCQGENLDFPYRDLFLHYRYLHEPEKRPQLLGKPQNYNPPPPSLRERLLQKLGLKS